MVLGFIPDTLGLAFLVSTILAGLRRSTGQTFKTGMIRNAIGAQVMGIYLGLGEWALDRLTGYARGSRYFHYDPNATIDWAKKQPREFLKDIRSEFNDIAAEMTGARRGIEGGREEY